jgi:hypothetical protein
MPSIALFAPVLLPLAAAALTAAFGLAGWRIGRVALAAGAWAALVALCVLWIPLRSTQDLNLGPLGFGAELDLRLDAVGFAFGLVVLVPAAVLLTLQPRKWEEGTVAGLGVAAAMLAVEGGGVLLTALAGGTAATLAVIQLDIEDVRAPRPRWGVLLAAWLALSWVGAILQVRGGTAVYAAVPVSAFTLPVFLLLAAAALMASGLFPWRAWPVQLWSRPSLLAAGMAVATVYPLGFYLLVRAYEMGDGRYPHVALNAALAALGVMVAFGAAARAQAAATRREYLAEVLPGLGGFALMGIALGTPVGVAAGLATVATGAILAACLPLVPDRAGMASLVAIAAAAGLPPGLAFGSRLVGLEATFEAGNLLGLIGIGGAIAWVVSMIAAARAIGLPAGRGRLSGETAPRWATTLAGITLAAGPALAALLVLLALPAVSVVMAVPTSMLSGGGLAVVTVTTVLPALTLFAPLVFVALLAYAAAGSIATHAQPRPPVFVLPGMQALERVHRRLRIAAVPEQYRSLVDPRALEAAAAGGSPVLWLAALGALAFAVTR